MVRARVMVRSGRVHGSKISVENRHRTTYNQLRNKVRGARLLRGVKYGMTAQVCESSNLHLAAY